MKRFNTTGKCMADRHYMVRIDRQVNAAARLVEDNMYFCINRGRQYGKTTTLEFLKQHLECEGYAVFFISFEGMPDSAYESLETLLYTSIIKMSFPLKWIRAMANLSESSLQLLNEAVSKNSGTIRVDDYSMLIASMCNSDRIVLIIDEVDQAGNYPAFIKFLGLLRSMYLSRDQIPTFQSVILAGVYDIKNLKLKLRPEELHQYNSPWNIAAPFDIDMSLHADGIAEMLAEYKADHKIDFDETAIAQMIYDYTSGYPFLVSRLCQIMDENGYTRDKKGNLIAVNNWDKDDLLAAINQLLKESNTLFDDITKQLVQFPSLAEMLKSILYGGQRVTYNYYDKDINLAAMFNFVYDNHGATAVSSRILETWLYNYFSSEERSSTIFKKGEADKNQFIRDGHLDMRHVLERFIVHFNEIYRPEKDDKFVEDNGRKIFLTYLRPIINGVGNYYCESQTRDLTRTDVVVDYLGEQFVVELKIWRGNSYHEQGEQQLREYLDFFRLQEGYLVSFCFNKDKQPGIHDVLVGGKKIVEALI